MKTGAQATRLYPAVTEGWSDDTKYTPAHILEQVSKATDTHRFYITVTNDYQIKWMVEPVSRVSRNGRGCVDSLTQALNACQNFVNTQNQVLF